MTYFKSSSLHTLLLARFETVTFGLVVRNALIDCRYQHHCCVNLAGITCQSVIS